MASYSSNRIKGITIEIGGDTTKLQTALKDVNKTISSTQSALKDVNHLLKLDPTNTTLLKQKQELLSEEIGATEEKLKKEKEALDQLKNSDATEETKKQQQALEREIVATTEELKNLKDQAKESASVLGSQMQAAGEKVKSVGNSITGVGKSLSVVSGAAAGVLTAAVKTAADFDSSMSNVAAISGATGDSLDALTEKAREMGSQTKFSASEAADAMSYMAMAGWKTEDMLDGIEGIMNLAAASGEDLATTSDIVTDALTAFGLTASDSAHFADILAAASSNANTNVSMMGETFKYAAPVMGAMGYSAEDVAVAIGIMGNAGIKATQAGTALRGLMTRMADPTDEVETAMNTLGITLDDGQGNMKSFMEIMQDLRSGFGELKISDEELTTSLASLDEQLEAGEITEKQYSAAMDDLINRAYGAEGAIKAQAASNLAGKNALSGLLAIVNASDDDFQKLTDAIYGCDGSAEEMAGVMQDNLNGQLTVLKSQLEELAISFGEILMPAVRGIVEAIQGFIDKLNGMDEGTKQTIVTILLIVAALAPFLIILGSVISAIGTVISTVGSMITFFSMFSSLMTTTIIPAVGSFIIAAGPVILIILAVVAAIVAVIAIIKNWAKISEWFSEKWTALKQKIAGVKDTFLGLVNSAKTWAHDMMENFIGGIKDKINRLKESVRNVAQTIRDFIGFSEPKLGPLSNAHTFMPDMVELMSDTLNNSVKDMNPSLNNFAGVIADSIITTSNLGDAGSVNTILAVLNQYLPVMGQQQIVLDTGALVGGTVVKMDSALGNLVLKNSRGI